MRIIAGTLKGRRLAAPTWDGLRPTSDKLRETLFNVIAARVPDSRLLDGFAGTGAVGIEALSRGAAHVTFIEQDARAGRLIAQNVERCGLRDGYTILRADVAVALRRQAAGSFDLIFLDPPYAGVDWRQAVTAAMRTLAHGGLLVLEHASREAVAAVPGTRLTRTLRSGDSALSFFEAVEAVEAELLDAGRKMQETADVSGGETEQPKPAE